MNNIETLEKIIIAYKANHDGKEGTAVYIDPDIEEMEVAQAAGAVMKQFAKYCMAHGKTLGETGGVLFGFCQVVMDAVGKEKNEYLQ